MGSNNFVVIVPAFNESGTIQNVVSNLKEEEVDVIVVDDGSTDFTSDFAREAGAIVISHNINQGYDGALETGFKAASKRGYQFVITFDADGQHNSLKIREFKRLLKSNYDMVIGIRPHKQRLSEFLFGLMTYIFWGIKDPLCGLKGYNIKLFHNHGFFDTYKSIGTELMIESLKDRARFVQIPVSINNRKDRSRFGKILNANFIILRALLIGLWKTIN